MVLHVRHMPGARGKPQESRRSKLAIRNLLSAPIVMPVGGCRSRAPSDILDQGPFRPPAAAPPRSRTLARKSMIHKIFTAATGGCSYLGLRGASRPGAPAPRAPLARPALVPSRRGASRSRGSSTRAEATGTRTRPRSGICSARSGRAARSASARRRKPSSPRPIRNSGTTRCSS